MLLLFLLSFSSPTVSAQIILGPLNSEIAISRAVERSHWKKLFERLTPDEKIFFKKHPFAAYQGYRAAKKAAAEGFKRYGNTETDDVSNAFKHSYWAALMTKRIGEILAEAEGTAHEDHAPGDDRMQKGTQMDLHNNLVGRMVARDYPEASEAELANLIDQVLKRGDLWILRGTLGHIQIVGSNNFDYPELPLPVQTEQNF